MNLDSANKNNTKTIRVLVDTRICGTKVKFTTREVN